MTLTENKTKTFKIEWLFSLRHWKTGVGLDKVKIIDTEYWFFAIHLLCWAAIFEWQCNPKVKGLNVRKYPGIEMRHKRPMRSMTAKMCDDQLGWIQFQFPYEFTRASSPPKAGEWVLLPAKVS